LLLARALDELQPRELQLLPSVQERFQAGLQITGHSHGTVQPPLLQNKLQLFK
jgi:hypothetical protein